LILSFLLQRTQTEAQQAPCMEHPVIRTFSIAALASFSFLSLTGTALADGKVDLQVLATTDLHMYLKDYDYYADKPDAAVGLVRVAPLIRAARAENPNTLLLDNGDLIQGTPMGDWVARERGVTKDKVHPAMAVMNLLGYDAAVLGNHEFNYGLDLLGATYAGAKFPVLAGNVFKVDGDKTLYPAYVIQERKLVDADGKSQTIKVGLLGLLTPQIMIWDKDKLEGRVTTRDIVDMAKIYVPEMKAKGADVVIVMSHAGMSYTPRQGGEENASNYLTEVPGVDAVITGHSHRVFPSKDYEGLPGADLKRGTVNGKPLVMAGSYGSHLGVIKLTLEKQGKEWKVVDGSGSTRPIQQRQDGKTTNTEPDAEVAALLAPAHEGTLAYVRSPVGRTTARIHSFFSFLGDSPGVELVAEAQRAYIARELAGTEYAKLPILSAVAPFKSGGRPGVHFYTDIPAGEIAIRNVADLYVYPNQLAAVKLTGAQVRDWLEASTRALSVINPKSTDPQPLVNTRVPAYNFDILDGVTYAIDLTQPERFDRDGKLINPDAHRIAKLTYQGKPVTDDQLFIVATNTYRANGGGTFPNLDGSSVVYQSPDTVQQAIVDYVRAKGVIDPTTDNTFSYVPLPAGVTITYDTNPQAQGLLAEQPQLSYVGPAEDGFARFKVDLSAKAGSK
jgi:2',3'-cyclic-nucleotide 2'-phosphodiesterase/3'-nucleotidase